MKKKLRRAGQITGLVLRIAVAAALISVIVINYDRLTGLDVRGMLAAESSALAAMGIVFGIYAVKSAVFVIPAMVIYTAVGVAFKTWQAILINAGGIFLEVILTWCLGRILGGKTVEKLLRRSAKGSKILDKSNSTKYPVFFGIRALPVFPIDFVSLFMGTTSMPFPAYLALSFFGILPRVILFTALGDRIYEWIPMKMAVPLVLALVCVAMVVWIIRYILRMKHGRPWHYESLNEVPRHIIMDTDMGPDCDDAGALAVLIKLLKDRGLTLDGVVNCTANPRSNGVIKAILAFCGSEGTRVGQTDRKDLLPDNSAYAGPVAEKYLGPEPDLTAEKAEDMYVDLLARAENDSVIIVSTGMLNNISALVDRYPVLLKDKVHCLVAMAGAFPEGREYNVYTDAAAAQNVFARFPAPIVCSGFEVGKDIRTGYKTAPKNAAENPIYDCYRLHTAGSAIAGDCTRESWDLTAVQFAVEGESDCYRLSHRMAITVDGQGKNTVKPDGHGDRFYLKLKKKPGEIGRRLDALLHSFDGQSEQ